MSKFKGFSVGDKVLIINVNGGTRHGLVGLIGKIASIDPNPKSLNIEVNFTDSSYNGGYVRFNLGEILSLKKLSRLEKLVLNV